MFFTSQVSGRVLLLLICLFVELLGRIRLRGVHMSRVSNARTSIPSQLIFMVLIGGRRSVNGRLAKYINKQSFRLLVRTNPTRLVSMISTMTSTRARGLNLNTKFARAYHRLINRFSRSSFSFQSSRMVLIRRL